jgi:hypothetical protein
MFVNTVKTKYKITSGVAEEIKNQIGHKACVMMGAKEFLKGKDEHGNEFLRFRIGRNAKSIGLIKVIYNHGSDTYTVEFWTSRGSLKEKVEDVYVDSLHELIEKNTGMYLSL